MIYVDSEKAIAVIEGDHSTTMAEITLALREVVQEMLKEHGGTKTLMSLSHLIRFVCMDDESLEKAKNEFYEHIKENGN